MKTRVAITAALLTVLLVACANKTRDYCPATTTVRVKNKSLDWRTPTGTTIYETAANPPC